MRCQRRCRAVTSLANIALERFPRVVRFDVNFQMIAEMIFGKSQTMSLDSKLAPFSLNFKLFEFFF